jgi:hypothetical protein
MYKLIFLTGIAIDMPRATAVFSRLGEASGRSLRIEVKCRSRVHV